MQCPEIIYDFLLLRQLLQEAKLELKKSKRKDFYKILGVEKTANDDEIKKAYRKRAMVHHPDRHSSASDEEKKDHETKFKEVIYQQIQLRSLNPCSQFKLWICGLDPMEC